MKKFLSFILLFLAMFAYAAAYSGAVCADISSGILRFHILANSDSSYDQQMKIAVRDYVCQNLSAESRVSSFDEYC